MSKITLISDCFVRPKSEVQDSKKLYYPPVFGRILLLLGFSQYGLVFKQTSSWPSNSNIFNKLKDSLSQALVYFYPLAGRLVTQKNENDNNCSIFVDCTKGPGARLIHASASGLTVNDVTDLSKDVPLVLHSFFNLGERQINYDGHTKALLSLQVTELDDGLIIGCCINHCLADATSVTHFLNVLSQIYVNSSHISNLPVFELPSPLCEVLPTIKVPYTEANESVTRFNEGDLRDRIFHFSIESMKTLKVKANTEANKNDSHVNLSSFKALCAHLWMCITRAQNTPREETTFSLAVNFRPRLNPSLSPNFFSSLIAGVEVTVKVDELLTNGLGWATLMIHEKLEEASGEKVIHEKYLKHQPLVIVDLQTWGAVTMGGSPWLDLYSAEFGLGKPVAVRTGNSNRFHRKIIALPSQHGSGSVDVQITLLPEDMSNLLLDDEFMKYVL